MFDIVKKELNISIVSSIVYIILGIVIVLHPETTLNVVSIAISILAIILGLIITIINITKLKGEGNPIFGILLLVLGISLLIYPNSLNVLISLGIGIWFITSSISRIKIAVMLKDVKEVNWLVILIVSIITLLIGITFIFMPLALAVTLATISGILMIAYSICDVFEILFIKKNMKVIQNTLEEQ